MAAAIPFVASAGLGAIQGNQAKQQEKGRSSAVNKIFAGLNPEVRALYEKALRSIDTGYTGAMSNATMAGTTAKFNAGAASKQNVAAQTDTTHPDDITRPETRRG